MNKKIYIIGAVVVLASAFIWLSGSKESNSVMVQNDYKNTTYTINGQKVDLVNGVSEVATVPGSATKIKTEYFGNELKTDLNSDGREDIVFLVTQNTGGSGTFYYVVAGLNMVDGYLGSHGILLGDRIAPQTTELSQNPNHKNVIVVNYADRKDGDSFAVSPSVGKSIWLKLDTESMQWGEVAQNFEGEADPSRMSLGMKKWTWVRVVYKDGKVVTPNKVDAFTITFKNDGTFGASTDCNGIGGEYTTNNSTLAFTDMISTLMFCEGSQEQVFAGLLTSAKTYSFTSKGELIINLKADEGFVVFR